MQRRTVSLLGLVLVATISLRGQCPARDSLWSRLILFRDLPAIAPSIDEQLNELLQYEGSIKSCSYQFDSTHALLLQRIGVLYSRQANYVKAIEYVKRAINIIASNYADKSINYKDILRNYFILSVFYSELNRIPEKMNASDSCIFISVKLNYADKYSLYPLWGRVEYSYDIGDYQRAFELASAGELIIKKNLRGKDSLNYITTFLTWKIIALLTLKKFDLAEKILLTKIDELKGLDLKDYWGTIYEQLAEVYAEKKEFDKAYNYFQLAFRYDLQAGYSIGCAQTLINQGYNLHFKGQRDFSRAINCFKRALLVLKNSKLPDGKIALESLNVFGNIAYLFVEQNKYDSAFSYFQKAFDQIRPGIQETEILQSALIDTQYKRSRFLVSLMIAKGDTYVHRYKRDKNTQDLDKAISIYKFTDALLHRIKMRQSEIQSKLFWRADNRRLYENAIEACYLANKPDMAFYFFEKSRAVLLNDQVNEQRWLDENEILQQAQVKRKILRLEREFDTVTVNSSRYAIVEKELFTSKQELNKYVSATQKTNPLYYQSFFDSSYLSIADVKTKILNEYPALLELFVGDSAVYVLVITKENNYFNRINKSEFDQAVNSYVRHLTDQSLLNHDFQGFVSASTDLNKLIFQNISLEYGRIIISPDGPYFPFEALVVQMREGRPVYFLEGHAVSYTYSARYLMNSFSNVSTDSRPLFLGVAPVKYSPESRLASLDGSDHSLQRIGRHFSDVDKMIGAEASRNKFLNRYFNYKIIQLYAHASDSSVRGEPVIWLADSVLYLSDLIGGNKPITRLIVLSACETGSGKLYQGEGVFSFNRGFAAIGIPSAITNLWSVDSKSTYELTELFYKYLSEGNPTDIALQKAKLEFIKSSDQSLPFYWAAPILTGKAEIIELKKSFNWQWFLLGFGIILVGGLVWWRMNRTVR